MSRCLRLLSALSLESRFVKSFQAVRSASTEYYRSAPEAAPSIESFWGRKAMGRYEAAICTALVGDSVLKDQLVVAHGFTVHAVRLTDGRRQLRVLYDCYPGKVALCEKALRSNYSRIRTRIQKNLDCRHSPVLQFTHDRLPPAKQVVAKAFAQIEEEIIETELRKKQKIKDPTLVAAEKYLRMRCPKKDRYRNSVPDPAFDNPR